MGLWVYVAGAVVVVAALVSSALAIRSGRRGRADLTSRLAEAQHDVAALVERVETLTSEVVETRRIAEERSARREIEPLVITGIVDTGKDERPRDAQLVQAVEAGRPQWVPAAPLREALVRTVSFGHGLRRGLSADNRDRILLEMRAEVRRLRRRRKAELKAVRKYLRDRRRSAA